MNYSCKWSVGTLLKLLLTKPGNTNPSLPLNSVQGINTTSQWLGLCWWHQPLLKAKKSDSTALQSHEELLNKSWGNNTTTKLKVTEGGCLVLSSGSAGYHSTHSQQRGLHAGGAGGWLLFEHMPFQVKLITLFITPAASGAIIITQLLWKKWNH